MSTKLVAKSRRGHLSSLRFQQFRKTVKLQRFRKTGKKAAGAKPTPVDAEALSDNLRESRDIDIFREILHFDQLLKRRITLLLETEIETPAPSTAGVEIGVSLPTPPVIEKISIYQPNCFQITTVFQPSFAESTKCKDFILYYKGHSIPLEIASDTRRSIAFAKIIEKGLDPRSIEQLLAVGFTQSELDTVISSRTLKRRIESQQPLSSEESERLVRYARIFTMAREIFGENAETLNWLRSPKKKLDDKKPLELLSTEIGAQVIEEYLGQIQSGYFA